MTKKEKEKARAKKMLDKKAAKVTARNKKIIELKAMGYELLKYREGLLQKAEALQQQISEVNAQATEISKKINAMGE